jgi:hypothetical protein
MNPGKTSSVEQLQVVGRFESLRKILLSNEYADYLDKPLVYWALPTDRRLPLALMGRTLGDLLNTSFSELSATPGIGQKKIRSLVSLLSRAASTEPSELPVDPSAVPPDGSSPRAQADPSNGFDPSAVSEAVWAQWRATVVQRGLGGEALGRFAPTLKNVTRVIWNTPLDSYTGSTLAEIRAMKTYGEKRVQAILEVFHSIHNLVAGMGHQGPLVVRIVPRLIDRVETWIGRALQTPGVPSTEQISREFVRPLFEQIRIDATQQITRLAECRLGVHRPIASVRQAARTMGLTRARVYQLLNEINDIMTVRWPMGRHQVYELRDRLEAEAARSDNPPDLTQFYAAVELFYPGSRRGASGPLEPAAEPVEDQEDEQAYELSPAAG